MGHKRRQPQPSSSITPTPSSTMLPSSSMMPLPIMDPDLVLFAFINELSTSCFPVSIGRSKTVGDLKKVILKENANSLKDVDANLLNLYKVALPDDDNLKQSAQLALQDENWLKAGSCELSELFPKNPPKKTISILVEVPNIEDSQRSRRPRLDDSEEETTDISWFKEVHSKIWGRQDLKPVLFRSVEVTRTHYDALQDRLNQKNPDRNSETYDASIRRFLRDKLDILESITLAAPSHRVGDDDDDDVVNSKINSLFPFTLNYLDMSVLELNEWSTRCPSLVFIRQEYEHITKLIDKGPLNIEGSVMVSGQPGTGKTTYLYLKMIESLIAGRPFLFQSRERAVYHVSQNGVERITSWRSAPTHIVAFVDADKGNMEPKPLYMYLNVQIIIASSPKGPEQKWIKQTGEDVLFMKLAISLWSCQELFLTGIFLKSRDFTFSRLMKSTFYFGYNPRHCFTASLNQSQFEDHRSTVIGAVTRIAEDGGCILNQLNEYISGGMNISHVIFQLHPIDDSRTFPRCQIEPVSPWVFDTFALAKNAKLMRPLIFTTNSQEPLGERRSGPSVRAKITWTYCGPINRFTFQEYPKHREIELVKKIDDVVQAKQKLHLVPSALNFPAVDSIVYDPEEVLTCIQVTISSHHPIVVSGLQGIQKWLKFGSSSGALRPKKKKPWCIIFFVLPDMEPTFELQEFEGDTPRGEWAGKVDQYVCGLKVAGVYKSSGIPKSPKLVQSEEA